MRKIRIKVLAIAVVVIIRLRAARAVLRSLRWDARYALSNARMVWEASITGQFHDIMDRLNGRTSCCSCGIETRGHEECDECRFGDLPM